MQLIQDGTQVGTTPPAPAAATGTPGYISNAAPGPGVTPTIVDPDVNNALIGEIVNLVLGVGLALAPGTFTQASQAARRLSGANVTSISASGTTILTADNAGLVLVNASAGAITIDMPAVATAGASPVLPLRFRFVRTDTSANSVTFAPAGSDTFADVAWQTVAAPTLVNGFPIDLAGDGASHWLQSGREPHGQQVFTVSGSFTVPAGVTIVDACVLGGGGGGGSVGGAGSAAGGGGAGGMSQGRFAVVPGAVIPVTVGAGGTASIPSAGTAGGTSSFGSLNSATGGTGGGGAGAQGGLGGAGSGTGAVNGVGAPGFPGVTGLSGALLGGTGGSSAFGGGGIETAAAGAAGVGFGSGGSGAGGVGAAAGGAGAAGLVIVRW